MPQPSPLKTRQSDLDSRIGQLKDALAALNQEFAVRKAPLQASLDAAQAERDALHTAISAGM